VPPSSVFVKLCSFCIIPGKTLSSSAPPIWDDKFGWLFLPHKSMFVPRIVHGTIFLSRCNSFSHTFSDDIHCHVNLISSLPNKMIFLLYTGTSELIIYISNIHSREQRNIVQLCTKIECECMHYVAI